METNKILETRNALLKGLCTNHTGKMTGLYSFSTSTLLNKQCEKNRCVSGSICQKCYATSQLKRYRSLEKKLEVNTELINREVFPAECFPQINALYFRFESFGDIGTETQVFNYFKWAELNPQTNFALFTKNARIIDNAIKAGARKPENLNIVYSSLFINTPVDIERIKNKYSFIDKVFTVYDQNTIKDDNIDINCGGRSCATCLRCYKKNTENVISEKLK